MVYVAAKIAKKQQNAAIIFSVNKLDLKKRYKESSTRTVNIFALTTSICLYECLRYLNFEPPPFDASHWRQTADV